MGASSRLLGSPSCFILNGRFHLTGLNQLQSCNTQDVDASIKIFQTLPDYCKRSTPSSLSSTRMTLPSQREVCCLVFLLDALQLCVPPDHRTKIWPQISSNLWCVRSTAFSRLFVPFLIAQRCCLSFPGLSYSADHTRRLK